MRWLRFSGLVATCILAGAVGGFLTTVHVWPVEGWTAAAAWATVLVAGIAVAVAVSQLGESRRLRREQVKPYVVVYMEPAANPHMVRLVVKNFGATAAVDVRLEVTPRAQRSNGQGGAEDVWLPPVIPTLVPGQSWETLWDFGPERVKVTPALPKTYAATVTYVDPNAKQSEALEVTRAVLDWGQYEGRRWMNTYDVHDAAKALREIRDLAKKWTEFGGGLSVWTRSGEARDERRQAAFESSQAEHEALRQRLLPNSESEHGDPD